MLFNTDYRAVGTEFILHMALGAAYKLYRTVSTPDTQQTLGTTNIPTNKVPGTHRMRPLGSGGRGEGGSASESSGFGPCSKLPDSGEFTPASPRALRGHTAADPAAQPGGPVEAAEASRPASPQPRGSRRTPVSGLEPRRFHRSLQPFTRPDRVPQPT